MSEPEFHTFWCPLCGGVAHPSSGSQYTETFVVCGPCARKVGPWLQAWTAGKGRRRGRSFYECVGVISEPIEIEVDSEVTPDVSKT